MSRVILDASVGAKWCLPRGSEELVEEAFALLAREASGEIRFLVPDLFWTELGNVLWKATRRGRCSKAFAEQAFASMQQRRLATAPSPPLLDLAFEISFATARSFYDSTYVALAVISKADFVTADERLANALAARWPVKWLGAF